MIGNDIYALLSYLKNNNIVLANDLKEEVFTSKLKPAFFAVLKDQQF